MSPTSYPCPDDAYIVIGGLVEVCLCRISWDSVGAGLWWICLDSVFVRVRLGVYRFDHSDFTTFFVSDGCGSVTLLLCGLRMMTS